MQDVVFAHMLAKMPPRAALARCPACAQLIPDCNGSAGLQRPADKIVRQGGEGCTCEHPACTGTRAYAQDEAMRLTKRCYNLEIMNFIVWMPVKHMSVLSGLGSLLSEYLVLIHA